MILGRWRKLLVILLISGKCLAPDVSVAETKHNNKRHHDHRIIGGPTSAGVSSILVQAGSGQVLDQNGADILRYPASLTKLMTLDLAFQALQDGRIKLDTRLRVSKHAAGVAPVKLYLRPGQTLTVREAILAMTTMSANDAATVLGEHLGHGSEWRFARMMTRHAHALGMKRTEFRNASGLPNAAQVTTARDLSILSRDLILHYPQYQHFFMRRSFVFRHRVIYSNNQMLTLYDGTIGMKTGYTDLARHNLITAARRHGVVLIGVVLHEPSWGTSYDQMTAMLDDGFDRSDMMIADNRHVAPAKPERDSSGSLLFPSADAATIAPPVPLAAPQQSRIVTQAARWAAQVGSYSHYAPARDQARKIRRLRGTGTAQVLKFHTRGTTLWAARVAGMTEDAARQTCRHLAARHLSCFVIGPRLDDHARH
jgi:D-alanyl-D-alanine carboxypeptidase